MEMIIKNNSNKYQYIYSQKNKTMKKTEIILFMFLFCTLLVRGQSFSGVSGGFITDSKPPEVTVIFPNGGESYFFTDYLHVKWYAFDDTLGEFPITIST